MDTLVNIILAIFHSKRVSNDCRKTKTNAITPITTGANRAMNESEFQAITCNLLKAQEKSRVMKKKWRDTFKPITKRNNRNRFITFDSNLKIAPCP